MAINRWEPFKDLMSLRQAMDRLFEESYVRPGRWAPARREEGAWDLPLDAYMTEDELVIVAALPGMIPDDVDITIEGDSLSIRGEFKAPIENVDYVMQERPYGKFSRTLRLNIPVEPTKAEALFENGLLTLTVPKAEEAKPKAIKVKAK